jgi:hypothetical protein
MNEIEELLKKPRRMVKKMFDDGRQELLLLPQARTHAQY